MANKEVNDDPIKNLESDIIYAVAVILISGVCGKAVAQSLTESIASSITIGVLTTIISLVLSFAIPFLLKLYFKDELDDVLSTPIDFIVCASIMIALSIICKDMIGPYYLIQGISAVVGLSIKYFEVIDIINNKINEKMECEV